MRPSRPLYPPSALSCLAVAVALTALATAPAFASPEKEQLRWAAVNGPAGGPPSSIGKYGAGCIRGAIALPLDGDGYQVMKPSRKRFFGHPRLIGFVRDLGRLMKRGGHGPLLVGDLGQPRGGPAPSGHSSHQTGLDVDIWYWHPKRAENGRLPRKARERLSARPIVNLQEKRATRYFTDKVTVALRRAASDDRVSRIFVNPLIKRELCQRTEGDRGWLQKIRPWWGHHAHFHVRLTCPEGSPSCEAQDPLPGGDGCAEVDWWLDEKAQAERAKEQKSYQSRVRGTPELPSACQELLGDLRDR